MIEHCSSCGRAFRPDDTLCGKCGAKRGADKQSAAQMQSAAPVAQTTATGPRPKRSVVRRIVAIASFAIIPIVMLFTLGECGAAEGQMAVSASPHGEFTFVATGCASMQPYGLMGANLHGDGHNDGAVYVTLDHASGHKVELEVPGSCQNADGTDCTVFEVPRASCSAWDVTLEYTNTTVNDVRLTEGHVRLECALEDGTRVSGAIEFEGC